MDRAVVVNDQQTVASFHIRMVYVRKSFHTAQLSSQLNARLVPSTCHRQIGGQNFNSSAPGLLWEVKSSKALEINRIVWYGLVVVWTKEHHTIRR